MTKTFDRNAQLITLASKTSDSKTIQADLGKWLSEVTEKNDENLRRAREYIDSCNRSDVKFHSSVGTVNKSASKRSSASAETKTSSQRQKDLFLATHRREELERQNAIAIRLPKQKQEIARKQLDREKERLEEEQALQLEELEEENRRKLAEAKLTELELTDDLSQATDELCETLSQISKHSKQTTSQRVSDWVNEVNEPDSVSNQPQTSSMEFDNVAGLSNPAVIPALTDVVQIRQATPLVRSSANVNIGQRQNQIPPIGISSNSTILRPNSNPPSLAAVNTLPFFQPRPVNTTSNTVSTKTVPMVNPQSRTLLPHVQPSVTQVNIPTSHVKPNLSAWSFPAPNRFPTVYAAVPQPVQGEVTSTSTTAAPKVTNTGVFTPVVPIQSGGTTFYCNPLATTIPVTNSSMSPCTTAPVSGPLPTFSTTAQSTVHLTTPTAVTVQDIAQLLTAAKKDHLPEWKLEQ